MNNLLIFDVRSLIDQQLGTTDCYSFDVEMDFEDTEIELLSNISGQVEMMKTDDGVIVNIKNVEAKVDPSCQRCLKKIPTELKIRSIERKFLKNAPAKIEDPADLYLIDMKYLTIDIKELLRQEIILHFPIIRVCSTSCKGLEEFHTDEIEPYKPLSILKELVKSDNHVKTRSPKKEDH